MREATRNGQFRSGLRTESGDPAIPGIAARRAGILGTAGGVYHIATNAEGAWEKSPCLDVSRFFFGVL
jgi:hypothetical protein